MRSIVRRFGHPLRPVARLIAGVPRGLVRAGRHLRPGGRGADRVRVPRRLSELLAGLLIIPLGATVTVTVAAMSQSPALADHATARAPSDRLTRFLGLLHPSLNESSTTSGPPPLATLPPAPRLTPMRPAPPRAPAIPASSYPPGSVQAIITAAAQAHGVDPSWMIRTATCESTLRPNAYNPAGPYYGLFQFLMSTFRAHGGTDIWDPTQQANIAASMFAAGDSSAWPVCSHA